MAAFILKKIKNSVIYYGRGFLMETKTWLVKAKNQKLITNEDSQILLKNLGLIHKKLNGYIMSISSK